MLGKNKIVVDEINEVLHIIDPIAFPYAISPIPLIALVAETIASGKVVPIETIVAPIIISETLKIFAILMLASIK